MEQIENAGPQDDGIAARASTAGCARAASSTLEERRPLVQRLAQHFPKGRVLRYLAVGAWNTLFGYGVFALLTFLLTGVAPYAYVAAAVLSNVVSITVSYLGYKWLVFQTRGNYLREYLRCYVVYGTTILVSLVILPLLVTVLEWTLPSKESAPYLAGAILTAAGVVMSYVGHKQYSFAAKPL